MRRITGLAMATLMVLGASACGSDDGDSASDEVTTTAGDTTTVGSDGGGDDGATDTAGALGLIDEDCRFLAAGAFLNPLASLAPGTDTDIEENSARLDAIADEAPEEIQDAMATIADGYEELANAFKDVDLTDVQSFSDPEVQAAIEDLQSVFDEEYQQAAQTLSTYISENCTG
jgi:ABC-type glycerol-3-phosphate transport system substrate-binding protein